MARRPIRWRVAEAFEGRWGWLIVLGIGAVLVTALVVPLMFRPFQGRAGIKAINQAEIRCRGALSEISRGIPDGLSKNNPQRVCVERARGRVLIGSVASLFILLFTVIALLARAGKIQPKDLAR